MAFKQNNNPFSRKTSSLLSKGDPNRTVTVTLPNNNQITTSIDNTNLNEKGETQSHVINDAFNTIKQLTENYNSIGDNYNLTNMSLEEATRFDEAEANAMNNLSEARQNFIRVSDSINNVNKKRFSPIKMTSPLNDNHDNDERSGEWEYNLDDGEGLTTKGEWGNETRTRNPDGTTTVTQTRNLTGEDSGGSGGDFYHPQGLSWDEWLQTPEGKTYLLGKQGQDTRSRTIRKQVGFDSDSEIKNPWEINSPEIIRKVGYTPEDVDRMKKQIEIRKNIDEKEKRKRKRKRWWSNTTSDIGDFVVDLGEGVGKGVGKGAEFLGKGIIDVATAPIDIARGLITPCSDCRGGLFGNIQDKTSLLGGRRGLRKML